MKLSEKGVEKVSKNCKNVMVIGTDDFFPPTILEGAEKLEFYQSDFTGAVVLTVEEAKVITSFFGAVDACCDLRMSKTEQKTWGKLNKRIEQAEDENA